MLPSRIAKLKFIPFAVRKVFYHAAAPTTPHEGLFQHVVGRAVMDALGFTGLDKPSDHNIAVRSARVWLKFGPNVDEYFQLSNIDHVKKVRKSVLATRPYLRPEEKKSVRKK